MNPVSDDTSEDSAMDNFRTAVLKIATSDPINPLTASRKTLIERRLHEFFPDIRVPDHPTYSAMIHRAIEELTEEKGSSEESISRFIRKEYDDLPWAHSTLLKHHLGKLCESGELIMTSDNSYLLADALMKAAPSPSPKREPLERKRKQKQKQKQGRNGGKLHEKKETKAYHQKIKKRKVTEEKKQATEVQIEAVGKQYKLKEQDEVIEYQDQVEEQQNIVSGSEQKEQNGVHEKWNGQQRQQNGVIEELDQSKEQQNDVNAEQIQQEKQQIELKKQALEGESATGRDEQQQVGVYTGQNQLEEQDDDAIKRQNQQGQYNEASKEIPQSCNTKNGADFLRVLPCESPEKEEKIEKKEEQLMKCSDIFGLHLQKKPELPNQERSSELELIAEFSSTQEQHDMQGQENPQDLKLEPGPSKTEQHRQEYPERRNLGPPSLKFEQVGATIAEFCPSQQLQQECPLKHDTATTSEESLPLPLDCQLQHEQLQQPLLRIRGRPRKQQQKQPELQRPKQSKRRGRPPKPKPSTITNNGTHASSSRPNVEVKAGC